MKRLALLLTLLLGLATPAFAQCVAVGGVNSVPQTGVTCASDPTIATYAASGYGIVPASSATDIACLTGSATKVIRVQSVRVAGNANTLVTLPILLTKHTVANTGGTAATTTALPVPFALDSNNPAATATTTAYTANPTVDTTANIIEGMVASFNVTGTLVNGSQAYFNYLSHNYMQAPVLRGIAQQVCVNLGGVSVSTGAVVVSFIWTEAAQ